MTKEIDNIKTICADIVQKAKSGHPGAPLGLSQFVYILYTEFLHLNPHDTQWINRDIIILSNGHSCVIQYVMNHLLGYLTIDDLKLFRQLNSYTPGHPEKNLKGIEISTGPLGQGVAASVGYAISSKILQEVGFNNKIYCVFGDGCYQEGIAQEAFSLCSKLSLNNITFIYDFNQTTIDGPTSLSMNENVKLRFESLNFDVVEIQDDLTQIREALGKECTRPKLIILHTVIGKCSELEGTSKAHGNPLGEENIRKLKEKLLLPPDNFFFCDELLKAFKNAADRMNDYVQKNHIDLDLIKNTKLKNILITLKNKAEFPSVVAQYKEDYKSVDKATRTHLKDCINLLETNLLLLSGCADLLPCINSKIEGSIDINDSFSVNSYIHYGIREHAMCGVMNGIASHGVFTPIGGTFLNFSSYGLPSIKLACMDKLKVIYLFTHDSIGLGEDGPTHQPIEALATLRAIPNMITLRPCDGRETRSALAIAMKYNGPSALILTRQPTIDLIETKESNSTYCSKNSNENCDVEKGAYFLVKVDNPDIILIATGSEVQLALEARKHLKEYKVSVVSMISFELFNNQPTEYIKSIVQERKLTQNRRSFIVSIEALSTFGWSKYSDYQIGMDTFGKSAPYKNVFEFFEFTAEKISSKIINKYKELQ